MHKPMKLSHLTSALLLAAATASFAQAPKKVPVTFGAGKSAVTLTGSLTGRAIVDYVVSLGAGQTLSVDMKATNGAAYFNVLPPNSAEAMVNGSIEGNKASRRVPMEGKYTVRVYLMPSSGRRNEKSNYTLKIGMAGKALASMKGDALVAGTPFHATANVRCHHYLFADMTSCEAGVVRRGPGIATVQFKSKGVLRRVLLVNGKAVAWDSTSPATTTRDGDETIVSIGNDETYHVPDALVNGG